MEEVRFDWFCDKGQKGAFLCRLVDNELFNSFYDGNGVVFPQKCPDATFWLVRGGKAIPLIDRANEYFELREAVFSFF